MSYLNEINKLIEQIPKALIDFEAPRKMVRTPTQAASNFITNKEQGDWAEKIIFTAINESSEHYVAIKYGKSDDIVAGEEGFSEFFESFQAELDSIGKRPDILLFNKCDYDSSLGTDISLLPESEIHDYVKKAVAGIEIRSSAFLVNKYDEYMNATLEHNTKAALALKEQILRDYQDLLSHKNRKRYISILENITPETIGAISFNVPGWGASDRLIELNNQLKKLKKHLQNIKRRNYLSITPKVEDLLVVHKWIQNYQIPHYYFQIFFDKAYAISFKEILSILSKPDNEPSIYSIEGDVANQHKKTIKIRVDSAKTIAQRIDEPIHHSKRKELARGQLLYYVSFDNGSAYLDIETLKSALELDKW
ncbi:MAG: AccI family restriction endonuclease [Candidatus Cloacimonetes bacterium]|nr:AccI family restriction endonuclease [Candidatus Cloacimonadota bacterium]